MTTTNSHFKDALSRYSKEVPFTWDGLQLAVLLQIAEELQTLNSIMRCQNVQIGFRALTKIAELNEKQLQKRVDDAARKRVGRKAAS